LSRSWLDEWLLTRIVAGALRDLGLDEEAVWQAIATIRLLVTHQRWFEAQGPEDKRAYIVLVSWLRDGEIQQILGVNRHQGILWFHKEPFEKLLEWMLLVATVDRIVDTRHPETERIQEIVESYDIVCKLRQAKEASDYQVEKLLEAAQRPGD
jgi:hypothetical protein